MISDENGKNKKPWWYRLIGQASDEDIELAKKISKEDAGLIGYFRNKSKKK